MSDLVCSNLATKEELQELRDQLNAALGDREEGGTETLFEKGKNSAAVKTALGVTLLGLTKTRASNALTDIEIEVDGVDEAWKKFKDGSAKWKGTKGNGVKKTLEKLDKISKTVGKNGGGTAGGAAVAAKNMAMMAVMVSLVNIAATLALNIATVKVFDARIDVEEKGVRFQLDALNSGMLRLYDKNQGDIDAANAEIENNRLAITTAQNNIKSQNADIEAIKSVNLNLSTKLSDARSSITNLQSELTTTKQQVADNASEFQGVVEDLTGSLNTIQAELGQAIEIINQHEQQLSENNARITILEAKILEIDAQFIQADLRYILLREEFIKLKLDLAEDKTLVDSRLTSLEGKIALTQKFVKANGGGSSGALGVSAAADSKTKQLALMAQLADTGVSTPVITATDLYNDTETYQQTFEQLLPQIETGTVDEQQLTNLREGINSDVAKTVTSLITGLAAGDIADIKNQTTESKMISATEKGICNSLNSPSCSIPRGTPNPLNGLKGLGDFLKGNIDALNAGLNANIIAQNNGIKAIVQNTNDVVKHAKYGLQAAQNFAEKAWEATHADKVLNAITTAVVLHNAAQLSTNLTATIGETTSVVLDAVGINDEKGNPFDVNAIIKSKLTSLLTALIGADNYAALTTKLAQYNRIYQAGANVLNAAEELFDNARSTAELTAENTGKIGNALLDSGAVAEDSYRKMADKISPHSKAAQRLERFRDGLETVDDTVSTVDSIASNVVSTKDSYTELKEAKDEWKEANEEAIVVKETEKTVAKEAATVTAEIDEDSFKIGVTSEAN